MTDKQFSTLWADALEANNRDAYASDWALSSMWEEDADIMELNEICGRVWDVAHMTVADIRNDSEKFRHAILHPGKNIDQLGISWWRSSVYSADAGPRMRSAEGDTGNRM